MRLKIGLVSPYSGDFTCGVYEHILDFAAQLILMGHEVRILASMRQTETPRKEEYICNMGWSITLPINGTVVSTTVDPTLIRRVQSVFQKENFDIIHIHEPLLPGLPLIA